MRPEARAVLEAAQKRNDHNKAFENAVLTVDVTSQDLEATLPQKFDLLAAGFPCQDLSQVGRTVGIDGSQSGLIGHVFQLLARRQLKDRPRWVVLENVPFMRHLNNGRGMGVVLNSLSSLGYSWAYREVDSMAFGLPQRRKRLFIVGCLEGQGDPRRVLMEDEFTPDVATKEPSWEDGLACGFYWTEGNRGVGWANNAIPTLKGGSGLGIPSPPAIILPPNGTLILPTIRDAESLQGFPRGWTEPASTADKHRGRIRWHLVGNAVAVPVAQWIGEQLKKASYPLSRDHDALLMKGDKWPPAAWQIEPEGARYASKLSSWPVQNERTALLALLREENVDRRGLSAKAAKGFLGRFEASNLFKRYPQHRSALIEILRQHVQQ